MMFGKEKELIEAVNGLRKELRDVDSRLGDTQVMIAQLAQVTGKFDVVTQPIGLNLTSAFQLIARSSICPRCGQPKTKEKPK